MKSFLLIFCTTNNQTIPDYTVTIFSVDLLAREVLIYYNICVISTNIHHDVTEVTKLIVNVESEFKFVSHLMLTLTETKISEMSSL